MVTKQEQLEWLAKECDEWPVNGEYFTMNRYAVGGCVHAHVVTREEWQQERDRQAELKAMTMQMCELKPLERDKMQKQDGKVMSENEFEDELEKMYWDFDAERAKKSKCERLNFKMFMRIASWLRVERKQDNSWHERGEFPPAGTECEAEYDTGLGEWNKARVIGVDSGECFLRWIDGRGKSSVSNYDDPECFRPLRTEREKAIDEMADLIAKSVFGSAKCQAEKLYDAGYRKQ